MSWLNDARKQASEHKVIIGLDIGLSPILHQIII